MKVLVTPINCGFSGEEQLSSAYLDLGFTLDNLIMPNYASTFIGLASGDSMNGVGIFDGDLLVIDRSLDVKDGDVVVANINGEFVCKILDRQNARLISASEQYKPVSVKECDVFSLEGIVSSSIRIFRSRACFKSKLY